MALKNYQRSLLLDTLYETSKIGSAYGSEQLAVNIWVNSGTVDIYGSNSATEPTLLSEMTLNSKDTNVGGEIEVSILPKYIALVQNTGTSTEIVSSGIETNSLGSIS